MPQLLTKMLLLPWLLAWALQVTAASPTASPTPLSTLLPTYAPGPTPRPTPHPSRPTSRPSPRPTAVPSTPPTPSPTPQPTLVTYEQLVFVMQHVALSTFQVHLTLDSVQMALKVALNVSAEAVGVPVASLGPSVPPAYSSYSSYYSSSASAVSVSTKAATSFLRRLNGSPSPSAAPTALSTSVVIATNIQTININTGLLDPGVVADTNSAVLLTTFKQNSQLFLSKFIASVTQYDTSEAARQQFASASIPQASIYVVSLIPTLAPVMSPVVTSRPTGSAAWIAVQGAEKHSLSIIIGASLGGVLLFLLLCVGCIAWPHVKKCWGEHCAGCSSSPKSDKGSSSSDTETDAAPPPKGCWGRLWRCLCCPCYVLARCICGAGMAKAKGPMAASGQDDDDEDDDEEEDEDDDDDEEEGENDDAEPEGTGIDLSKVYKKDAAPFTTPKSAAEFTRGGMGGGPSRGGAGVRASHGGALGKTSSNPLATAPVSPARRLSTKK